MRTNVSAGPSPLSPRRWVGIDFSGDHRMWAARTSRSNVWVATLEDRPRGLVLADLKRVHDLPGTGEPFPRLAEFLRRGDYSTAGLDAPFSLPLGRCPKGGHAELLERASAWNRDGRPFAEAGTLLRHLRPALAPPGVKEFRAAELGWGVNVRSTTWCGPRGGAAMTVACLTLLAQVGRPIWPFADASTDGLLMEAFPAAQLRTWKLPYFGYNGSSAGASGRRRAILEGLRDRVTTTGHDDVLLGSADALDAVVCAFAGRAVRNDGLARPPAGSAGAEGWIAVHAC
jgi:hypothetical protein